MKAEEKRKQILKLTKKSTATPGLLGNPKRGLAKTVVVLENRSIGIKLEISSTRSQKKNRDLGMKLMELAINDLII